jgi:hypothetical protein
MSMRFVFPNSSLLIERDTPERPSRKTISGIRAQPKRKEDKMNGFPDVKPCEDLKRTISVVSTEVQQDEHEVRFTSNR